MRPGDPQRAFPPRSARLLIAVLGGVFAFTRLYELLGFPIFLDEALHVFWPTRLFEAGRIQRHLADGKSLQVWMLSAIQPLSPDPPWSARFLSVLVGGVGLAATHAIGTKLYGPIAGAVSAALYLVCPFLLFYERLALADIYVSTFAALTLLASIHLARNPRTLTGLAVGLAVSGCALSKMTGLVEATIPVVAVALLTPRRPAVLRHLVLGLGVAGALCAYPAYYFLRQARPWVHLLDMLSVALRGQVDAADRAAQLGGGHAAGAGHMSVILANLVTAADWLAIYCTLPLLALAVAGSALAVLRRETPGLLLTFCAALPVLSFAPISQHWHPRYIVSCAIPIAVLGASALTALSGWLARQLPGRSGWPAMPFLATLLAALASIPALRADYLLLSRPERFPLPEHDRLQYVEGWSSGFGIADVARYVRAELSRDDGRLRLVTHRFADRTVFLVLRAYLMNEPRVELLELDLAESSDELSTPGSPTTLLALGRPDPPERGRPDLGSLLPGAVHLFDGVKPDGELAVEVFRLPGATRARGRDSQGALAAPKRTP